MTAWQPALDRAVRGAGNGPLLLANILFADQMGATMPGSAQAGSLAASRTIIALIGGLSTGLNHPVARYPSVPILIRTRGNF